MDLKIDTDPKTPPRLSGAQILTPPPSGTKTPKRLRFLEEFLNDQEAKRVCSPKLESFFDQPQAEVSVNNDSAPLFSGVSSADVNDVNAKNTISTSENRYAVEGIEEPKTITEVDQKSEVAGQIIAIDNIEELADAADVIDVDTSNEATATQETAQRVLAGELKDLAIDFMALPKEIRNKIYELLLVVPALVAPRQNRTASHENCRAFLYTEELCLLPGICFVLTQTTSSGMKKPFHRYQYINVAILRISKKVHAEAADVLYGINDYDIANLSSESAPAADFKCRLFPRKYQMLVRNITLRGNTIYTFRWILTSGLKDLKAAYGSLSHLMLLLELPSTRKGWAKAYSRGDREKDELWITRLRDSMAKDIFGCEGVLKSIPIWIDIKVVFEGEEYISSSDIDDEGMTALVQKSEPEMDSEEREEEVRKRMALKKALPQAFELFKRGHRR